MADFIGTDRSGNLHSLEAGKIRPVQTIKKAMDAVFCHGVTGRDDSTCRLFPGTKIVHVGEPVMTPAGFVRVRFTVEQGGGQWDYWTTPEQLEHAGIETTKGQEQ